MAVLRAVAWDESSELNRATQCAGGVQNRASVVGIS